MSAAAQRPSADRAERAELTRIARNGALVMALGMLVMGGWLIAAPLSGAVIAAGFVKVDMNRKMIQHQEGGIVKQVLVRDGERVKAGQVLVVIEDVQARRHRSTCCARSTTASAPRRRAWKPSAPCRRRSRSRPR